MTTAASTVPPFQKVLMNFLDNYAPVVGKYLCGPLFVFLSILWFGGFICLSIKCFQKGKGNMNNTLNATFTSGRKPLELFFLQLSWLRCPISSFSLRISSLFLFCLFSWLLLFLFSFCSPNFLPFFSLPVFRFPLFSSMCLWNLKILNPPISKIE